MWDLGGVGLWIRLADQDLGRAGDARRPPPGRVPRTAQGRGPDPRPRGVAAFLPDRGPGARTPAVPRGGHPWKTGVTRNTDRSTVRRNGVATLAGWWSIRVSGNWRVVFRFANQDVELMSSRCGNQLTDDTTATCGDQVFARPSPHRCGCSRSARCPPVTGQGVRPSGVGPPEFLRRRDPLGVGDAAMLLGHRHPSFALGSAVNHHAALV
jgi:hypothetical protein